MIQVYHVVVSLAGSSPFSMVWSSLLEYEVLCAQCIRSGGVGTRCSGIPLSFLDCVFSYLWKICPVVRAWIFFACLFADVAHSASLSLPFSCVHSCQVCQVPWCDFLAGNEKILLCCDSFAVCALTPCSSNPMGCNSGKLFSMVPWSIFSELWQQS